MPCPLKTSKGFYGRLKAFLDDGKDDIRNASENISHSTDATSLSIKNNPVGSIFFWVRNPYF